jgi:serine/threonine protein kinase
MYRSPEMLDRWQGFDVDGYQADIWMFGCVLYVLCTGYKHPFQFESNLAIINAQY